MNDPYSVLGVSPSASDDDIKRAYRDLARKYHPDNYVDNPLADLAQEKMKEINEAYDQITKMRAGGNTQSGYSSSYSSYSSNSQFSAVRSAINRGDLSSAEQMLNSAQNRNAEWNFLMGSLYYKRGWIDDARSYYQRAVSMEPGNGEYQQALMFVNNSGTPYRQNGYGPLQNGIDPCDICAGMMCANMLCRCM